MEAIMEAIAEFILELIFGVATERKISKWIRYPLLVIAIAFCLIIVGLLVWSGIEEFETSRAKGIILWVFAIFFTVLMVIGFTEGSKKRKKKLNKK